MEARTLSQFIVVAEEKNIRRAAARLHITQSALTRKIQALEEEVGAKLFTRGTSGVEITDAGQALLHHARNIITELEQAKKDVLRVAHNTRPQINIGVYGSAAFTTIPQIIELFTKNNPGVDVVLHSARKEQQIQSLRHGKILIAFDRFLQEEPDIACEEVLSEPILMALHKEHPLAHQEIIDMRTLQDELFIGSSDKSHDEHSLRTWGYVKKIEKRVDDLISGLTLVDRGFGIFYAPPSAKLLPFKNIVYREFTGSQNFYFKLQCIYLKKEKNPLLSDFLDTVHTYRANIGNASSNI